MAYSPQNSNGQATSANSSPVVLASDQSAVPVSGTFYQATQPVSLASVPSHAVTNAGTFATQVDGAALTALQLIDDPVGSTASAVPAKAMYVGFSDGTNVVAPRVNVNGDGVAASLLQGHNLFGYNGSAYDRLRTRTGASTGTLAVSDLPATSGGLSIVTGSVGATATAIKASAGQLYGYHILNTTAAVAYVQLFNVAAGSVTLGTTVPVMSIGIPASGGVTVNFDKGIAFSTAISFACTTTRTGSTGATCDVNFFYA